MDEQMYWELLHAMLSAETPEERDAVLLTARQAFRDMEEEDA